MVRVTWPLTCVGLTFDGYGGTTSRSFWTPDRELYGGLITDYYFSCYLLCMQLGADISYSCLGPIRDFGEPDTGEHLTLLDDSVRTFRSCQTMLVVNEDDT